MNVDTTVPRPIAFRPGVLLVALALLGACNRPGDPTSSTAPHVASEPRAMDAGAPLARNDAEILGTVAVLDRNLVALAQQAIDRHIGSSTEDFARQVVRQHNDNIARGRALGAVESGPAVQVQQAGAKSRLDALAAYDDENSYRTAFTNTMAMQYSQILQRLDSELIPACQGKPVCEYLASTRRLMATGLERAKSVDTAR